MEKPQYRPAYSVAAKFPARSPLAAGFLGMFAGLVVRLGLWSRGEPGRLLWPGLLVAGVVGGVVGAVLVLTKDPLSAS